MDERVCQGYRVIDSIRYGGSEVVLAHNPEAHATPYVTWRAYAVSDFKSFDHGEYFSTEQAARVSLYERAAKMWSFVPEKIKQLPDAPVKHKHKPGHDR